MDDAFKKYMSTQIHKIDVDKWNEGVKIKHDPGVEFITEWIEKYGAEFHKLWDKSLCKDCIHCDECGHEVVEECEKAPVV